MRDLFILLSVLFCLSTSTMAQGHLLFTGHMTGAKEIPGNNSTAQGFISVIISEDFQQMQINGVFSGLSGSITAVRFHQGQKDMVGPAVVQLTNNLSGNRLSGIVNVSGDFIKQALNNNIYINVITQRFTGGEIRSQLELQSDQFFPSYLTGAQEVPAVSTTASGLGGFNLRMGAQKLQYFIMVRGLSGPITAAHIHEGTPGRNGGPLIDLQFNGNILLGEIALSALPNSFLTKVLNDQYYVNVHTAANPSGEIRGNIFFTGPILGGGILNGDQQSPPVTTSATGLSFVAPKSSFDSLQYIVIYDQLSGVPNAAHIHKGKAGTNGPVVHELKPGILPGSFMGTLAMDNALFADYLKNNLYINIHTAANPGGEIRSQAISNLRRAYAFDLCGAQQVPAINVNGYGVAAISVGQDNTTIKYQLAVDGMTGEVTDAHIHREFKGANGSVLYPLQAPKPYAEGILPTTGNEFTIIDREESYINVHTMANPLGEIRGQINRSLGCAGFSKTNTDLSIHTMRVLNNPVSDNLFINMDDWKGDNIIILVDDLFGRNCIKEEINSNTGIISLPISLQSGSYFIYAKNKRNGQQTTSKKFIVR